MDLLHFGQVEPERIREASWQQGDAVFLAFAIADQDLAALEVEVLHAQPTSLEESQARSVQERRHEPGRAAHAVQNGGYLGGREDHGHALWPLRSGEFTDLAEGHAEDVEEQEEQSRQRLVLAGCADLLDVGEVAQVLLDLRATQLAGEAVIVEDEEPPNPMAVGFRSAGAVPACSEGLANTLQQGRLGRRQSGWKARGVHGGG